MIVNTYDAEGMLSSLRALLATVELRNPAIPTSLSITIDDTTVDQFLVLQVIVEVPDRDSGDLSMLRHNIHVPPDDFLTFVRRAVRAVWVHELDESWHVDGVRVNNPHFPSPSEPWVSLPIYEKEQTNNG